MRSKRKQDKQKMTGNRAEYSQWRKREAVKMKLQGLSYREIGAKLGVTRQRAQQLVRPPALIYKAVRDRAKSRCEKCRTELKSGHVHHKDTKKFDDYNDIGNLQYLCTSCHVSAHAGDNSRRYRRWIADFERKLKQDRARRTNRA